MLHLSLQYRWTRLVDIYSWIGERCNIVQFQELRSCKELLFLPSYYFIYIYFRDFIALTKVFWIIRWILTYVLLFLTPMISGRSIRLLLNLGISAFHIVHLAFHTTKKWSPSSWTEPRNILRYVSPHRKHCWKTISLLWEFHQPKFIFKYPKFSPLQQRNKIFIKKPASIISSVERRILFSLLKNCLSNFELVKLTWEKRSIKSTSKDFYYKFRLITYSFNI